MSAVSKLVMYSSLEVLFFQFGSLACDSPSNLTMATARRKIGMSDTNLIVFTALNVLGNTLSSIALLVFQQARPFYDISSVV